MNMIKNDQNKIEYIFKYIILIYHIEFIKSKHQMYVMNRK